MFGMIRRFILTILALLLLPSHVHAQADDMAHDLEGTWALQIDGAVIFTFALSQDDDGEWDARWTRPADFASNGVVFSRLSGSQELRARAVVADGATIRLTFPNPRSTTRPDNFLFEQVGEHQVAMTYVDTPFEPYPLVRVRRGTPLGPFDEARIYDRDNAAVEADYDPAMEEEVATEAEAVAEQAPADAPTEGTEATDARESAPQNGLADDFLAGLDDVTAAPAEQAPAPEPSDASEATNEEAAGAEAESAVAENTRACTDLDRRNLPTPEELAALWGDDFEPIGSGLDIREYTMANGDIARITNLGDRIYLNSCGAAD